MKALLIISVLLNIVLFVAIVFLIKEFLQRFSSLRTFGLHSGQTAYYHHPGTYSPGMKNIVLHGNGPFCALIGIEFNLSFPYHCGFNHYEVVSSNKNGIAVISTYLGKGACTFFFITDACLDKNYIEASCIELDQTLKPDVICQPHWYQRFGFYA